MEKVCINDDCDKPGTASRGRCRKHYTQWYRSQDLPLKWGKPIPEKQPRVPSADITYHSAHARVRVQKGNPSDYQCIHCDRRARDWAYNHKDPNEKTWVGQRIDRKKPTRRVYSLDPNCYQPMCRLCHKNMDRPYKTVNITCEGDCRRCGKHFYKQRSNAIYCSDRCRASVNRRDRRRRMRAEAAPGGGNYGPGNPPETKMPAHSGGIE